MGELPEADDPLVIPTQGYTPRFWENRSVIFIANLLSLFFGNRHGARQLEEEITCVDSYGGRLLPILGLVFGGKHNLLVLERQPDPALAEFFRSLDLDLPETEILTRPEFLRLGELLELGTAAGHPLINRLLEHPADTLDGFVTDRTIARLASALGKHTLSSPEGSHRGNNKLLLHQYLHGRGLPVFPTELAESPQQINAILRDLRGRGHSAAVVKSQIGASGIGLMKVATDAQLGEVSPAFFHEGPCLVQAWLTPGELGVGSVMSPSVQLFLNRDSAYLYDLTEQILDPVDSIHQGNESPPPYLDEIPGLPRELFRQAGEAAVWLHRQGYRGPASVDFLLTLHEGHSFTAYVCEINARVTGATYPSVLARHFHPRGTWRMRNLEFLTPLHGGELLDKLGAHTGIFRPGGNSGILPVNFNLEPDGLVRKGQFLAVADTLGDCRELLETARRDIPVPWDYIRDR